MILTQEYRHGIGQVVLGLPGGSVEPDEMASGGAGLEQAARRELLEETGYRNGKLQLLLKSFPNPATHNNTISWYLAVDVKQLQMSTPDQENGEDVRATLRDFPTLLNGIQSGELFMDAGQIAALWSAAVHILQDTTLELKPLRQATRLLLFPEP